MRTIFTGPYAARFWRARRFAAAGLTASSRGTATDAAVAATTMTTDAVAAASAAIAPTPPPLRALQQMRTLTICLGRRRCMADALSFIPSSSIVSTPSSLPLLVVRATITQGLSSLTLRSAPTSMQLARLPVRLLTHLVQWRRSRSYCAPVSASTAGDADFFSGRRCMWAARARRRGVIARLCSDIPWASAMRRLKATADEQPTTTRLALLASVSSPCISTTAQSIISGSTATSSDSPSTGAAPATPAGSLHTARRCYSSTAHADGCNIATEAGPSVSQPKGAAAQAAAGSAAGKIRCGEERPDERECSAADRSDSLHEEFKEEQRAKEDDEKAAPPSFAEIYCAFRTLQLVQDDGRVVQEWTTAHLKQAYRTLAKQLHPDVAGGDDKLMERVNTSYDLLMDLSAELADNYRMWLKTGGEAELQMRAQGQQELLRSRWASHEVEQLMIVGWCATLSGFAVYAMWRALYGTSPVTIVVDGSASVGDGAVADCGKVHRGTSAADVLPADTRLTLPRTGATVSTAAGVQYGLVSIGGSALWMPPHLSFQVLQMVRTAVSRYALAVALTLAACMNTVMLQRILQRLLISGAGGGAG